MSLSDALNATGKPLRNDRVDLRRGKVDELDRCNVRSGKRASRPLSTTPRQKDDHHRPDASLEGSHI